MATRCEYLTARCPYGCEVWLHPKAVAPHADRCRKIPWTESRRPVTEVLVAEDEVERARSVCPPELVSTPTFSDDRLLNPRPGMYLHPGATNGVVVRSPLDGITGRRWWSVAQAASGAGRAVAEAFDPDAFLRLEWELELTDQFVRCDICGDDVKPSRLKAHRSANSVCRFISSVAEVRTYWALGYRDPYRLRDDGVPITWTELNSRVHWRNRLHVVRFRLWTAVLFRVEGSEIEGPTSGQNGSSSSDVGAGFGGGHGRPCAS